jgi:hypothetical protein
MLNARHPWIQGSDIFMVDRDGKAFDIRCHGCGEQITTIGWWEHAASCAGMEIPVVRGDNDVEAADAGGGGRVAGPLAE